MRVIVTGSEGQVGRALLIGKPTGVEALGLSRAECDITSIEQLSGAVQRFLPDAIINAAAYTNVERAESDRDTAFAVNGTGAQNVAVIAQRAGARLIHISTDYVFDGRQSSPYLPTAAPAPLNVYGASKFEGEKLVLQTGAATTIVRTGWVYSATGKNFLTTVLRLIQSGEPVRIVCDQIGTPTSALDLAEFLWKCLGAYAAPDVVHWTNSGVASWYDFAVAVNDLAAERGVISKSPVIQAIPTSAFPTSATRPPYSVLDSFLAWDATGVARHWRAALADTLRLIPPDTGPIRAPARLRTD